METLRRSPLFTAMSGQVNKLKNAIQSPLSIHKSFEDLGQELSDLSIGEEQLSDSQTLLTPTIGNSDALSKAIEDAYLNGRKDQLWEDRRSQNGSKTGSQVSTRSKVSHRTQISTTNPTITRLNQDQDKTLISPSVISQQKPPGRNWTKSINVSYPYTHPPTKFVPSQDNFINWKTDQALIKMRQELDEQSRAAGFSYGGMGLGGFSEPAFGQQATPRLLGEQLVPKRLNLDNAEDLGQFVTDKLDSLREATDANPGQGDLEQLEKELEANDDVANLQDVADLPTLDETTRNMFSVMVKSYTAAKGCVTRFISIAKKQAKSRNYNAQIHYEKIEKALEHMQETGGVVISITHGMEQDDHRQDLATRVKAATDFLELLSIRVNQDKTEEERGARSKKPASKQSSVSEQEQKRVGSERRSMSLQEAAKYAGQATLGAPQNGFTAPVRAVTVESAADQLLAAERRREARLEAEREEARRLLNAGATNFRPSNSIFIPDPTMQRPFVQQPGTQQFTTSIPPNLNRGNLNGDKYVTRNSDNGPRGNQPPPTGRFDPSTHQFIPSSRFEGPRARDTGYDGNRYRSQPDFSRPPPNPRSDERRPPYTQGAGGSPPRQSERQPPREPPGGPPVPPQGPPGGSGGNPPSGGGPPNDRGQSDGQGPPEGNNNRPPNREGGGGGEPPNDPNPTGTRYEGDGPSRPLRMRTATSYNREAYYGPPGIEWNPPDDNREEKINRKYQDVKFDNTMKTVNWYKFSAAFEVAIGSRRIRDKEKLLHLLSLLEGEPAIIANRIAGDEYTRDSYRQVWHALEEAYGGVVRQRHRLYEELMNWTKMTEFTHQNTLELTSLISNITRCFTRYNGAEELDASGTINISVQRILPKQEAKRYFSWIARERLANNLYTLYDFIESERAALAHAAILNAKATGRSYIGQAMVGNEDGEEEPSGSSSVGESLPASESFQTGDQKLRVRFQDPKKEAKDCEMCTGQHRLWACPDFKASTIPVRFKLVQEKRICFHCLNDGHGAKNCQFKRDIKCGLEDCTRYHHRLLHQAKESGLLGIEEFCLQARALAKSESSVVTSEQNFLTNDKIYDAIRTVPAYIVSPTGQKEKVWVALDSCSTSTNIDADTAKRLKLKIEEESVERNIGVLQSSVSVTSKIVSFALQTLDGKALYPIRAFTVQDLVAGTPVVDWTRVAEENPHLKSATIPKANVRDRVRILLGVDHNYLMTASSNLQGREDEPIAEYCKLGWSFSGRVKRAYVMSAPIDDCNFQQSFTLVEEESSKRKLIAKPNEVIITTREGTFIASLQKVEFSERKKEEVPTCKEDPLTAYEKLPETITITQEEYDELHQLLQKNWDLEAVGLIERVPRFSGDIKEKPEKHWTRADIELDARLKCVYLPAEKKFQVSIPWKQGQKPHFQNNRDFVVRRTNETINKLEKEHKDEVRAIFQGYEDKGYVRRLTPEETKRAESETDVFYLPFFCVKKAGSTTPVRIVWDCAAKYYGRSLNSEIELTPNRLQDLFKLLLRVRKYRYVVMSDISEMFLRIKLDPEDRRYHRFHYDGSDWEWLSILFGNNSSPNASQKVISVNCDVNGEGLPEAVLSVKESCYMDDVADSRADEERAVQLALQLIKLFEFCNMPVHKFYSNSEKVCRALPANLLAKQITFDENTDDLVYSVGKVLGMSYSVEEGDVFTYAGKFRNVQEWTSVQKGMWTKTDVARISASIFDPLGLISPFTVRAKIVMQMIWRTKKESEKGLVPIDWKDPIPEAIATLWESWLEQVFEIPNIKIPRWTRLEEIGNRKHSFQVHTFCDASEEGVCVATYIRVKEKNGDIITTLLAAKSRVTPLKAESISRLELIACVLAVRVCSVVRETYPSLPEDTFYWTDSEVCLHWLNMSAKSFKAFVAHRVGEIQNYSEPRQWQHVPGVENPADIGTRPVTAAELKDRSLWWEGPEFLKKDVQHWPKSKILREIESSELKADIFITTLFINKIEFGKELHPKGFSVGKLYNGFQRLVRRMAYVFMAVRLFKRINTQQKVLPEDFRSAKDHLFRQGQQEYFPEEIGLMSERLQPLARTHEAGRGKLGHSPILLLNPVLDPAGVMRSSSRLRVQKGISYDKANPVILHRKSEIARLIVEDAHTSFAHPVSASMMKAKLRDRFVILGLGRLVRDIRSRCVTCKKARAQVARQQMAKLPSFRLGEKLKAFDSVGIDFAGPFNLRVGRGKIRKKSYILVMTCMTTRAVHLEATGGMETVHVINAISRFCDVRGVPTKIISDNQTSFTRANKDLIEWYGSIDWTEVERKTGNGFRYSEGIEWIFNPPHAPHFGGAFEIMVKAVKRALKECVSSADLDEEEFRTCVSKVSFLLNNRPIQAFVPMDSEDLEILTPNHFLLSHQGEAVFPPDIPAGQRSLGVRLRLQDEIQKHIWKRFQKELVPLLAPRQKWKTEEPGIKTDDVIIEIDENTKRGEWKMRRVHRVIESDDSMIRKVELISPEGRIYLRPISRCIPIL